MYRLDLSVYVNLNGQEEESVFCVGWLDAEHAFPTGVVGPDVLEAVLALCFQPVNSTRGFHQTPFLAKAPVGFPVEYRGKAMMLGSAEIRVRGKHGVVYAAPNLIYHYMKDCRYLPPPEFLQAVLSR